MDAAHRFSTVDSGAGRHDETFAPKAMRPGHLEHTDEGFEGTASLRTRLYGRCACIRGLSLTSPFPILRVRKWRRLHQQI